MKKFIESVCVSEYEIGYMEINNSGYQFKMYRDCSTHYQSDAFWMDDSDEYYCDIRITRIA